jgi:hypothetical protein
MISLNKSVPVHAVKAYRGSNGINPLILSLGNRWRKRSASSPGHTPEDSNFGTH